MPNNFNEYGKIYDFFYYDKNYRKESDYLIRLIKKYLNVDKGNLTILDIGCGTGGYAQYLNHKFNIIGIDLSKEMIKIANKKNLENCKFYQADGMYYKNPQKYDVIISMFHVINYQIKKNDFNKFMKNALWNLKPGGIFIFDFWNTPAALYYPPESKIKIIFLKNQLLLRHTLPERLTKNRINIKFDFYRIKFNSNKIKKFSEIHKIRTLDKKSITFFTKKNFKLIELNKAFTTKALTPKDWFGIAVIKKVT